MKQGKDHEHANRKKKYWEFPSTVVSLAKFSSDFLTFTPCASDGLWQKYTLDLVQCYLLHVWFKLSCSEGYVFLFTKCIQYLDTQ